MILMQPRSQGLFVDDDDGDPGNEVDSDEVVRVEPRIY